MRLSEKGYTLVELLIAITIMALASTGASAAIFQIFNTIERNNNRITVVFQVQYAGSWISDDAQMAHTVTAANLTPPYFLHLGWTQWDDSGEPTDHSIRYFFEDLSDGIGKLKRNHFSTSGINEETLIAEYMYYDPGSVNNTSSASYLDSVLTVRLAAHFEETVETREYRIKHRAELN
ncbi:type II secretion system protein J [Chloroflexota bacterium]